MRKGIAVLFTASLLFIYACDGKKQAIEKDKLAKIYVDLMVVKEKYSDLDSLRIFREEVMEKYDVTDEQYKRSFAEIENKEEEWKSFFDKANAYLDSLKASAE